MIKSMYIHIPFCKRICSYCDFCKILSSKTLEQDYIEELKKEIKNGYQNEVLDTIYIGGGSPSCLSMESLESLFEVLDSVLLSDNYEFTFECNVEQITEDLLQFLKKHRINRLSVGVETLQERFLSFLNRRHTVDMVRSRISLMKQMGFSNMNIDFMYAFPNQTVEEVKEDLETILSFDVAHISTYSLILEENTMLSYQKVNPTSEDIDSRMYEVICQVLLEHGYQHYEISNFAKEGYSSRHNLTYWNNLEYYGFGLGASGYVQNVRYTNTRGIHQYLRGKRRVEEETVDKKSQMSYEMILGLRKLEGVNEELFYQKFGYHIEEVYDIISLEEKHLLESVNGFLRIPEDKIYISNQILVSFLEEDSCYEARRKD